VTAADYLEQRADQAKHEAEDRAAEILVLQARIEAFREYRTEALAREREMRSGALLLRIATAT
jgi:hypothetical protein